MSYGLRKIIPIFVVSLALIRFWIEVVATTFFKNSALIQNINNNNIGYHHYQLGILLVAVALLAIRLVPKWTNQALLLLGFGFALFLDQYTYTLSLFGLKLPFEYRSQADYLIIAAFTIGLLVSWIALKKMEDKLD